MRTWKGIIVGGAALAAVLAAWLDPGFIRLPARAAEKPAVAPNQSAGAGEQDWTVKRRKYQEVRWYFDIVNGNVRFSHGNHKARDRWFRAYFRKNYECGVCHNTALPKEGDGGVVLSEGEPLNTVEDVRNAEDDVYAYGVKMLTCLGNCHNNFTAPGDCAWCHLPGSKPIKEGMKKVEKW